MFMNNQNSRMSRIADHNIYLGTDNLYEPLRNALRKSTVSSNFLSPPHQLADNRLSASRVAKNARSLSPAETEMIKKSIFIPVNKELVPTRNLQKVMGKQFVTVDMEEKVGEPISPAEFSRVKTGTIEEIVYQIKQEPQFNSIYTATVTNRPQVLQMPQHHPRPSYPQMTYSPPNRLYTTQQQPPINIQSRFTQPQQNTVFTSRTYEKAQPPQHTSQNTNMPNFSRQSNGPTQNTFVGFQSAALPTITSQEIIRDPQPPTTNRSVLSNKQSQKTAAKAYDFRQSTASKENSIVRIKRQNEEYKYNLFSLIDEGGNNGCKNGCFGSNEFIAPKITSNSWK